MTLVVYEPTRVTYPDAMLLFITGQDNGEQAQGSTTTRRPSRWPSSAAPGSRCCYQVPNQPLLDDKKEDELIAETFVRYLQTKDENWPLLFPMAKSAVRAMDAVQAWAKEKGKPAVRGSS